MVISVPDGEQMARKTTNARLGIIGGISILGTTGIVRPFSTASWRASVEQAISVLAAQGEDTVVLCTGGRTEKGAMRLLPQLPEVCFVEVGDFTGAALRRAVEHGLARVVFAGMAGKLTKLAAGVLMTHYTRSKVSLDLLEDITLAAGGDQDLAERVANANTARHAAELWDEAGLLAAAGRELCDRAARVLSRFCAELAVGEGKDHTGDPGHHGRLHRPDQDRRGGGMSPEVTVIGCDGRPFGPEAAAGPRQGRLVIGAPRHLDADPSAIPPGAERVGDQAPRRGPRRRRRANQPE